MMTASHLLALGNDELQAVFQWIPWKILDFWLTGDKRLQHRIVQSATTISLRSNSFFLQRCEFPQFLLQLKQLQSLELIDGQHVLCDLDGLRRHLSKLNPTLKSLKISIKDAFMLDMVIQLVNTLFLQLQSLVVQTTQRFAVDTYYLSMPTHHIPHFGFCVNEHDVRDFKDISIYYNHPLATWVETITSDLPIHLDKLQLLPFTVTRVNANIITDHRLIFCSSTINPYRQIKKIKSSSVTNQYRFFASVSNLAIIQDTLVQLTSKRPDLVNAVVAFQYWHLSLNSNVNELTEDDYDRSLEPLWHYFDTFGARLNMTGLHIQRILGIKSRLPINTMMCHLPSTLKHLTYTEPFCLYTHSIEPLTTLFKMLVSLNLAGWLCPDGLLTVLNGCNPACLRTLGFNLSLKTATHYLYIEPLGQRLRLFNCLNALDFGLAVEYQRVLDRCVADHLLMPVQLGQLHKLTLRSYGLGFVAIMTPEAFNRFITAQKSHLTELKLCVYRTPDFVSGVNQDELHIHHLQLHSLLHLNTLKLLVYDMTSPCSAGGIIIKHACFDSAQFFPPSLKTFCLTHYAPSVAFIPGLPPSLTKLDLTCHIAHRETEPYGVQRAYLGGQRLPTGLRVLKLEPQYGCLKLNDLLDLRRLEQLCVKMADVSSLVSIGLCLPRLKLLTLHHHKLKRQEFVTGECTPATRFDARIMRAFPRLIEMPDCLLTELNQPPIPSARILTTTTSRPAKVNDAKRPAYYKTILFVVAIIVVIISYYLWRHYKIIVWSRR